MRLIDADGLFSAIGDKEDDISRAKDRAAGSWKTYYDGVADGLLLAKGLIAKEKTIEICQKSDALYKNLEAARERTIRAENIAMGNSYAQARHECDYDRDTDSCRWNPAMKWQLIRETHAKALLMYIRKNAENGEIELTKLQKRCRGNSYFKTSEAREAALKELERCGYIRIKTLKYSGGGRPDTIIELTKEGKEND